MIKSYYIAIASLLFFGCQKIEVVRITKVFTETPEVNSSYVSIDGIVVDVSDAGVSKYGHCWSTNNNPTVDDFKTVFNSAVAGTLYSSEIKELKFNTLYYIRSYTDNDQEVIYGNQDTFRISEFSSLNINLNQLNILGENEVNLQGTLSGIASLKLEDYGVCYKKDGNPTILDVLKPLGVLSSNTTINESINSLLQERHYQFRFYAVLDSQTVIYSNELSTFITDLHVTTNNSFVTSDSVIFSGSIDSLGVLPITDHGHCWSYLTSNPTVNDNRTSLGLTNNQGVFISSTTLLNNITNVLVYSRAYAIKNNVIVYGDIKSFNL